ncbi:uncharacterized protein LOC132992051 [Labrus mixtus]|uniref:uncharacterized protein LOC132992051 n=1 Tax=Labrus mixtus TaxID=508554 RepID=UPI0029C07F3A|nr:uncharacterized protein LOC132992051 [Labrus mixtus]
MTSALKHVSLPFNNRSSSHMEGLRVFLVILQGVGWLRCISGSVSEVKVRPGDNTTLYCDCKKSTGEFIVWYRNCSHENQPSLVLKLMLEAMKISLDDSGILNPLPRFRFVNNQSSESYDLLIVNITDSDLGLYYCGTEQVKVLDKEKITKETVYKHGNMTTRVVFNSSEAYSRRPPPSPPCSVCWMLLFSLCPAFAVVSSLLSSALVYHLCRKTAFKPKTDEVRPDSRGQTRGHEDEDVCYSALNIRQTSQRPKKTQSSDFSTYSIVNTSRI